MGYLHEKRKKTKSFSNQWRWKQIVRFQSAGARLIIRNLDKPKNELILNHEIPNPSGDECLFLFPPIPK